MASAWIALMTVPVLQVQILVVPVACARRAHMLLPFSTPATYPQQQHAQLVLPMLAHLSTPMGCPSMDPPPKHLLVCARQAIMEMLHPALTALP